MSDTKARQTTDSKQGGEGTRAGSFDNPGLNEPTTSIGSNQAAANEAEKPLDDHTK